MSRSVGFSEVGDLEPDSVMMMRKRASTAAQLDADDGNLARKRQTLEASAEGLSLAFQTNLAFSGDGGLLNLSTHAGRITGVTLLDVEAHRGVSVTEDSQPSGGRGFPICCHELPVEGRLRHRVVSVGS